MWRINGDGLIRGKVGIGYRDQILHPNSTLDVYGNISSFGGSNFKVKNYFDDYLINTELSALRNVGYDAEGHLKWTALYADAGSNHNNFAATLNGKVQVNGQAIFEGFNSCPEINETPTLIAQNDYCSNFSSSEFSALKHFSFFNNSYFTSLYVKKGGADFACYFNGNVVIDGGSSSQSLLPSSTLDIIGNKKDTGESNFRVKYASNSNFNLSSEFSALKYFHDPVNNSNFYWTSLFASQGNGDYAGYFNGKVKIDGTVSLTGEKNFVVTNINSNSSSFLGNSEFSALSNISYGSSDYWTALYANQGNATFAGFFNGDVSIIGNQKVQGNINCLKLTVESAVTIPDYVFEKGYIPISIKDIETYISINKHLPEVPSATEIKQNGCNVGDMNMILLKKVEELTLYIIDLKNDNEKLNSDINDLKKNNNVLFEKLSKLQK
jgi:hypothetical protein